MFKRKIKYSSVKRKTNLANWNNKLQDVPCFILGNGPSLNDIDVRVLRNFFTIGINRVFYKIDPTILMWQDVSLWYTERGKILQTESIKLSTSYADPENRFLHYKIDGAKFEVSQSASILHGTGTTVPLAIQLAIVLGCNPIVLCGCDCKARKSDTNFYGRNKFHNANTMKQCSIGLQWIKTEIHDKKIKDIISCSDNDIFVNMSLESFLQKIDKKHMQNREYYNQYLLCS